MHSCLKKLRLPLFRPKKGFLSPFVQSFYGMYYPFQTYPNTSPIKDIMLPDGDLIRMEEDSIEETAKDSRIIILLHGLSGSSRSRYMIRVSNKLSTQGYRVFRVNLRGCGIGQGFSKSIYHGGVSKDIFHISKQLEKEYPHSPITLVGFSLGGNIALKLGGELGKNDLGSIDSIIALSPPIDLEVCSYLVSRVYWSTLEWYLMSRLQRDLSMINRYFSDIPPIVLQKVGTISEFENIYACSKGEFKDRFEYYKKCSSNFLLKDIKIPNLILASADDPVIPGYLFENNQMGDLNDLILSPYGGHLGFIAHSDTNGDNSHYCWMDSVILKWIQWHEKKL